MSDDDSAVCGGDSGGPVFTFDSSKLTLVGVLSSGSCDNEFKVKVNGAEKLMRGFISTAMAIRAYSAWLNKVLSSTEKAGIQYGSVPFVAAESKRSDSETIGMIEYLREEL